MNDKIKVVGFEGGADREAHTTLAASLVELCPSEVVKVRGAPIPAWAKTVLAELVTGTVAERLQLLVGEVEPTRAPLGHGSGAPDGAVRARLACALARLAPGLRPGRDAQLQGEKKKTRRCSIGAQSLDRLALVQ